MELDEAIKHCEDKAKELRKEKYRMAVIGREREWADCLQCAEEHEQLAKWLTDYKRLKSLEEARPTGISVIKCKDCKHQIKEWREDRRMKEKGYWSYGCEYFGDLMGYWGFGGNDNEFCSEAEQRDEQEVDDG